MGLEPLDESYLRWLYSKICSPLHRNPERSWWLLFRQLYTTEFIWLVSNDGNRCDEGKELREEFIRQNHIDVDQNWMDLGCSVLEMLIALTRRCSFLNDGTPAGWFWRLMRHLELDEYNDASNFDPADIDAKLTTLIWRRYEPNGYGGLFPLQHPHEDQRGVEIWDQLNAFLLEDE